jgi:16S rRNA (uracil1498-N3)-methyltransferase
MLRLHLPAARVAEARIRITGAELRHVRAHRLGAGDRLVVFDDSGAEHELRLERVGPHAAEAAVLATRRPVREAPLDLVLAPALLKGPKMDLVIEKATELGVRRVAPVTTARTLGSARTERWRRIALAAAKQCGRTTVPAVDAARPLADLVRAPWPGLRLIAWEEAHEPSLAALPPGATAAVVVVGPEGGLTQAEVADAGAHGFLAIALSPRVLRAETASLVAAALCQHRWGDM